MTLMGATAAGATTGLPLADAAFGASAAGAGFAWPFVPLAFASGFFSSGTGAALVLEGVGAAAFFSGFLESRVLAVADLLLFGGTDFGEDLGIPDKEGRPRSVVRCRLPDHRA